MLSQHKHWLNYSFQYIYYFSYMLYVVADMRIIFFFISLINKLCIYNVHKISMVYFTIKFKLNLICHFRVPCVNHIRNCCIFTLLFFFVALGTFLITLLALRGLKSHCFSASSCILTCLSSLIWIQYNVTKHASDVDIFCISRMSKAHVLFEPTIFLQLAKTIFFIKFT